MRTELQPQVTTTRTENLVKPGHVIVSDRVYPPTAYTGHFLQSAFSGCANRRKLITSFTQTIISLHLVLKPRDLKSCHAPLVTTGLLA